jgi:hypothetical protein
MSVAVIADLLAAHYAAVQFARAIAGGFQPGTFAAMLAHAPMSGVIASGRSGFGERRILLAVVARLRSQYQRAPAKT